MNNKKRSAFTIVELVIVIAVIAILSAVLIPTFGAIIKDANVAADQTAAASLTTELHIYLKGNTIDSEEELMTALEESGVGEKLVPKALAYGYHFWFDMKNQMIVAMTATEVNELDLSAQTASVEQDGVALASEVNVIADNTNYANVGIRDVFDKGYYLISNCGNLADALNLIENLKDGADYKSLIKYLENAVNNDADNTAATAVLNKVKETTIRTQFGVFFYSNTVKYEHISSSASYLSGPYYNYTEDKTVDSAPNPTGGTAIKLPSNIKAVMEGGLNYATAQGTTVVMPSVNAVIDIFTPASTNAIISIGGVEHIVTTADCAEHNDTCDVLAKKDGTIVEHLELKLAFENFYVNYEAKADGTTTDRLVDGTTEPNKVYVAYRNGRLQLFAVNSANTNETSNKVQEWKIDETATKYGNFTIDPKTGAIDLTTAEYEVVDDKYVCEVPVKAIAKNINGDIVEDTVTVVVIKPVTATLDLGSTKLAFGNPPASYPALTFNGPLTSYGVSASVIYTRDIDGVDPLNLRNNYVLNIDTNNIVGLLYDGNKMSFKTNAYGELISNTYSFKVSVDGCFETVVSGEIADATAAPVRFNYKQYNQAGRPQQYYVGTSAAEGTNKVMLSDLFTLSEVNKAKLGNATVTIYVDAELDGSLYPSYEIKKMFAAYAEMLEAGEIDENPYTLNAKYTEAVTESNWNSASIEFIGTITSEYTIYVEISPEYDVSTVVRLEVINGVINVSDLNDLPADDEGKITLGGNVALHGDCKIETGTTINVGAHTLYGNGYVIDAEEYKSSEQVGVSVLVTYSCSKCAKGSWHIVHDSKQENKTEMPCYLSNVNMITIDDGKVENIYVNGPVYPNLQYTQDDCTDTTHANHAYTPYYVSGIKTTGDSTISNSYIKGFRQPVLVAGDAAVGSLVDFTNDKGVADKKAEITTPADNATLTNTILHGGNLANLTIASGNVILNDVTTVQDFYGMTPTVDYASTDTFKVTGVGIMLEGTTVASNDILVAATEFAKAFVNAGHGDGTSTAVENKLSQLIRPLSTKVDINGSFTQHNWVEKHRENIKLPTVPVYTGKEVEMEFVLNTIFNGVEMSGINLGRMGRFMHLTHQDIAVKGEENVNNRITNTNKDGGNVGNKNELVNLGIIFIDVEEAEGDPVVKSSYVQYLVHIDESGSTSRKHATAELQLSESIGIDVTSILTGGADASLCVWSYADGRAWLPNKGGITGQYSYATIIEESTNWDTVHVVTDNDRYYDGYYATSDAYKTEYAWEINNRD